MVLLKIETFFITSQFFGQFHFFFHQSLAYKRSEFSFIEKRNQWLGRIFRIWLTIGKNATLLNKLAIICSISPWMYVTKFDHHFMK